MEVAIAINQLATPGLGSWIAGHRLAGAGQLVLACAGFGLYLVFFFLLLRGVWSVAAEGTEAIPPPPYLWKSALLLFGAAWLWAGVTSVQMALELRRRGQAAPAPPRLPPPG